MKTSLFFLIIVLSTTALCSQEWIKREINYSYKEQNDYYLIGNETNKNITILHLINEKDNLLYNSTVLFETDKPVLDEKINVMFKFDEGETFHDEWTCNQSRNNALVLYREWFIYMVQKSKKLKLTLKTSNGKYENTFNLSNFKEMIQKYKIKDNFRDIKLSNSITFANNLEKAFLFWDIQTKVVAKFYDSYDIFFINSSEPIDKGKKMELITNIVDEFDLKNSHPDNHIYYMHNDYNFENVLYYVVGKKR